jgi:hypothetical protein
VISFTPWPLYSRRKNLRYPLDRGLGGPQSRSRRRGEENIILHGPCRELNPDCPSRSQVATLSEVYGHFLPAVRLGKALLLWLWINFSCFYFDGDEIKVYVSVVGFECHIRNLSAEITATTPIDRDTLIQLPATRWNLHPVASSLKSLTESRQNRRLR